MCETCGCGDRELVSVEVHQSLLADNDHRARHNREHLDDDGTFAINLMGSPGSGKTAVLEATATAYAGRLRLAAMSGDLATDLDAARLEKAGIPAVSITTGTACHLDARQVHHALHRLGGPPADLLFIENVGNLVCPSIFDLGQHASVVAFSVTEGEDKPLKYPPMFERADAVLLTKIDLLPYLDVRLESFLENLGKVMARPVVLPLSGKSGAGIAAWTGWLDARIAASRATAPALSA